MTAGTSTLAMVAMEASEAKASAARLSEVMVVVEVDTVIAQAAMTEVCDISPLF